MIKIRIYKVKIIKRNIVIPYQRKLYFTMFVKPTCNKGCNSTVVVRIGQ